MFGDVGRHMLELMGHSGSVPGALLAEDVPAALQRLQAAVNADKQASKSKRSVDEDDDEQAVGLSQRALPLIELLKAAVQADCNVMWDGK